MTVAHKILSHSHSVRDTLRLGHMVFVFFSVTRDRFFLVDNKVIVSCDVILIDNYSYQKHIIDIVSNALLPYLVQQQLTTRLLLNKSL